MTTFEKILAVSAAICAVLLAAWLVWAIYDICRDICRDIAPIRRARRCPPVRLADTLEWRTA